ncbi:hypothetical protein EON81_13420 [bacterium]|nr:MAG: hypothetical protein EON81_13420 [bacterium]
MTDIGAVRSLALTTLKGLTALTDTLEDGPDDYGVGVYPEAVVDGGNLPAVVVEVLPFGDDVDPQGAQRQMSRFFVTVKVLESYKRTEAPSDEHPGAELIDGALRSLRGIEGGYAIRLRRVGSHSLTQDDPPLRYRQTGGRYVAEVSHPLH